MIYLKGPEIIAIITSITTFLSLLINWYQKRENNKLISETIAPLPGLELDIHEKKDELILDAMIQNHGKESYFAELFGYAYIEFEEDIPRINEELLLDARNNTFERLLREEHISGHETDHFFSNLQKPSSDQNGYLIFLILEWMTQNIPFWKFWKKEDSSEIKYLKKTFLYLNK